MPTDRKAQDIESLKEAMSSCTIAISTDYSGLNVSEMSELRTVLRERGIKYKVVKNLGQIKYLSTMKYVDLLIGNSSSGIIEAASFKKPVINIGDRQKGRLRGENVIDCNLDSLQESIKLALSNSFRNKISNMNNIYGTGAAADIILDKLINEPISVIKKFRDQP